MNNDDRSPGVRAKDEILAAEYVLGLLSIDGRRMVERRMTADQPFATAIERWQVNLSSFDDHYEDVLPSEAVLAGIERRLFGQAEPKRSSSDLWNSMAFWRWLSLGTSVAAVAALIFASGILFPSGRNGSLVAELSAPSNAVNMLASYDAASGRMRIVPVAAGRAQEKSLELWLVPGQGDPFSLGVLPADTGGQLVIPADFRSRLGNGVTLAVTLEPFGGSPTGRPTGAIVASGTARSL